MGFPALKPPAAFTAAQPTSLASFCQGRAAGAEAVAAACNAYAAAHPGHPCWLLSVPGRDSSGSSEPAVLALTEWAAARQRVAQQAGAELCLAVADCSNLPANPGWPLRNALLLAAARCGRV